MLSAIKWLRRHPNLLVLLAGIWLAAAPVTLEMFVQARIYATGEINTKVDEIAYRIYSLRYMPEIAAVIFFIGCGIALAALVRMLGPRIGRWARPD